jgi:alanine dehydrogenase
MEFPVKIGVPKEIKRQEFRVGLVPGGVSQLVLAGHTVFVEQGAGLGSNITDQDFIDAGAQILPTADDVWSSAEMIIKVKEPLEAEHARIQHDQIIYTYFHLAAVPELLPVLIEKRVTAVAYETIQLTDRSLPLLKPMSEVAGRLAPQVGARCLEKRFGGKGVLLGGVPGVPRGRVVILGGGVVGTHAAKIAVGMGARVSIVDIDLARLNYLDDIFGSAIDTVFSNPDNIAAAVQEADLVIGAVLIPGAKAPKLVTRDLIRRMAPGSVVVDVAVDQGGCIATCKPTTHDDPTYVVDDVVHYCVANMPGSVPRTSTFALTNTTLRYAQALARHGVSKTVSLFPEVGLGINTFQGHVTHPAVAESLEAPYKPLSELL